MTLQRIQDFAIDYFNFSIEMIDDSIFESQRYDDKKIVNSVLAMFCNYIIDSKFIVIAKDFNGLDEIEMLWSMHCGNLYSRGGYKDTIYAVAYEIAYDMRFFAMTISRKKSIRLILDRRTALAEVLKLPDDLIIRIGDYLYPY